MTVWQKAVKYAAMAFAIFLIVSIFGGILAAVGIMSGLSGREATVAEMQTFSVSQDITALSLDVNAADIRIVSSDVFGVESNLKALTVKDKDGVLTIREKSRRVLGKNDTDPVLTLMLPSDTPLRFAEITTGAGRLDIAYLCADRLSMELGAGQVRIDQLKVTSEAEINGGAGAITVNGGILHNLDLEMGIGELKLTAQLLGSCELDLGVGESTLVLLEDVEGYSLDVHKGIGSISVSGIEMVTPDRWGHGQNRVSINGGIGRIAVTVQ